MGNNPSHVNDTAGRCGRAGSDDDDDNDRRNERVMRRSFITTNRNAKNNAGRSNNIRHSLSGGILFTSATTPTNAKKPSSLLQNYFNKSNGTAQLRKTELDTMCQPSG